MEMNNATLRDCGENNSANNFAWLIYLILAIGCGVLIFMMIAGNTEIFGIQISRESRSGIFYTTNLPQFANASLWTAFALIMLILGFIETVIKTSAIGKTNINITPAGVSGKCVSKRFNFGAYRTRDFELSINQIDDIEISKNFVELKVSNLVYRIYVKNPAEIQNALLSMK